MDTKNNSILITGGGSGIGFETARLFSKTGNKVIIVGRNERKLREVASKLGNVIPIKCDITVGEEVNQLVDTIETNYSDLNILMNNAGKAHAYNMATEHAHAFEKAREEMNTNFLAPVRLTELLLPLLKRKKEAAIINVSSITSFAPGMIVPTYSATKAALHSYTQTLRLSLQRSSRVKVFEILPPLVDTEFARELTGNKIPPSTVAEEILKGMEAEQYEIHVGSTSSLYSLFLTSPAEALKAINHII